MKFVFVADFFIEQILGGGELNNEELIKCIRKRGHQVKKINSQMLTESFINNNKNCHYIIGNFVHLSENCKKILFNMQYVIYEHDHKYITTRNPGLYKDYMAPKEDLINLDFYKNAQLVLCQSQFHRDIIYKNTNLKNLINLSGNLWDLESLEFMRNIFEKQKNNRCSIMNSPIEHKNTSEAIKYCKAKNLEYDLISDDNYYSFLEKLGTNDRFIFLPKTPETLSRVVVEARMMGVQVVINKKVGAASEPWFKSKGPPLIDLMIEKRHTITDTVIGAFQ